MTVYEYPCPDCGTTNNIHSFGCEYDGLSIQKIREASVLVVATLLDLNAKRAAADRPPGVSFAEVVSTANEQLQETGQNELWRSLHTDILHRLKSQERVREEEVMGGLYLTEPDDRRQEIIPTFDPIKTIYEHGPVDGAKDYAVYSMVSWTELVGLNWEQACNFLTEWLEETNSWEELRWGESSIQALLNSKQHVHDRSLGWGDYAGIAADHIRQSDRPARINAYAKQGTVDAEDYDDARFRRTD